jgi:protein-S-isoprenylcysteine O-methyltransferase Ste14
LIESPVKLYAQEANRMNKILELRPPRIAMALLAFSIGLWYFSPYGTMFFVPYRLIAGVIITLGFAIMMWAWFLFKKFNTVVCPTGTTSTIVTKGVYKFSRNPMYLGMTMMLTGASFLMGSAPSFFAPVVFFLIIDKVFIPYEEEKLFATMQDKYSQYFEETRRWV